MGVAETGTSHQLGLMVACAMILHFSPVQLRFITFYFPVCWFVHVVDFIIVSFPIWIPSSLGWWAIY